MYRIDSADDRRGAPLMSAYPKDTREFTEPVDATNDVVIGPGLTSPDLIRIYYPGAVPTKFSANYGFLERDNKFREYKPNETDPFIFKNMAGVERFRDMAHRLMKQLCDSWIELGFKTKFDDDRKIDVPDSSEAYAALSPSHPLHNVVVNQKNDIYFILGNADIIKKAALVRTVNAGWWAVSYKGKNANDFNYFGASLRAHKRAIHSILRSNKGRAKYHALWEEAGDPILTNPGYPFFNGQVDSSGNPVTRIKTVELFRNLMKESGYKWEALLASVDQRAGRFGLQGFPFAIAPLRRLQYGRKWQHQFRITGSGLRTSHDEKGVNSQRVAHMVPYAYNVITSPVALLYKAARYFLPGCYHDGSAKRYRMDTLRAMDKRNELWLLEADYSNFDRFIPVDLITEIISWFTEITDHPKFWYDAMTFLHKDATLLWPDYAMTDKGGGWAFKPGDLGLLSGVNATSEIGTLVNSVVNSAALMTTYNWTENQLYDYLTQYMDSEPGTKQEYYYVMSDDTQLIATDPVMLKKHGENFSTALKKAGLKGSVEFADRFLMRHLQGGADRPVPARVWQNTISNETPVSDEIIFLAGLGSRTDGLLGLKSVDPFGTGTHQAISKSEAVFTTLVLSQLLELLGNASSRSSTAVTFLQSLFESARTFNSTQTNGVGKVSNAGLANQSITRMSIVRALAKRELDKMLLMGKSPGADWLYALHRDRHSPASGALLEELESLSPLIKKSLDQVEGKEHAFFVYATKTIGVRPVSY